jgi:membrane protease YdiL (CAAX protease family)
MSPLSGRPPWVSGSAVFRAPPGWPVPPPGWEPPPYWLPPPWWPPAPPGWGFWEEPPPLLGEPAYGRRGWALDEAVRAGRMRAGGAWGWGVALWPVAALAAVMVFGGLILLPFGDGVPAAMAGTALFYGVLVGVCVHVGRPVAARAGGWPAAFGLGRPRWLDAPIGAAVACAEFLARIIAAIVLVAAFPALQDADASNLDIEGLSGAELAMTAVVVVVAAPIVEEILFRGLILRTAMTRMRFWPAALASSAVFAVFHAPAVGSLAGASVLVASIFVFSLGQCLLVRWQGRLAPAMVSHGVANGIALMLAVSLAS